MTDVPPTIDDDRRQHDASGCLFLLLWLFIGLALLFLAWFGFVYHLARSIGS